MTLTSWIGAIGLGAIMCGIMWWHGRRQYNEGWNAGFTENLKLRLTDIKDGLASSVEIYHSESEEEED
jgi:hypothetical protein